MLDLDSDGIETVSNEAGIKFDFDGDLTKTGTGWIKADDGILVLDRNGSGAIESGAELFGVDTVLSSGVKAANGFEALADLDTNRDGKFASVSLELARDGNNPATLKLSDNGRGFADLESKGTGMRLINGLLSQLGTQAQWHRKGGVRLIFDLPQVAMIK